MDIRQYKRRCPALIAWPGTGQTVGLLPLSDAAIDAALGHHCAISVRFGQNIGTGFAMMQGQLEILAASVVSPTAPHEPLLTVAMAAQFTPAIVDHVFTVWLDVQRASVPDPDALERAMIKALREDGQLIADGLCATQDTLTAYYGQPVADIPDGQIVYYFALRSAYGRVYGPDSRDRTTYISNEFVEGRA